VPTYQYACTDCGDRSEAVQRFSDDPLTVCSACGGKLRKVFSPVGIVFKGSGFYRTDSRDSSKSVAASSSANGSNGSSTAAEKSGSSAGGSAASESNGSKSSDSSSGGGEKKSSSSSSSSSSVGAGTAG
jgi:putative FmdB family regulatory protein